MRYGAVPNNILFFFRFSGLLLFNCCVFLVERDINTGPDKHKVRNYYFFRLLHLYLIVVLPKLKYIFLSCESYFIRNDNLILIPNLSIPNLSFYFCCRRPAISMDHGWKHFKFYMLYAWGCPIVLTACMAIVNFYPGKHQKPGIGLNHCWFFSKYYISKFFYQYIHLYRLHRSCFTTN